jgi:hypothetical protein
MLRTPAFAFETAKNFGYPVITANGRGFIVAPEEYRRYEFMELLERTVPLHSALAYDGKQWRCKKYFVGVVVKGVRQVFKCSDLTSQKLQEIEELNKCYNAAPANPASKQQRDPPKRKGKQAATLKADWESPSESDEDFPPVGSSTYKLKPFAAVGYEQAMPSRCPPPRRRQNPLLADPPPPPSTPLAMLNFARIPR